MLNWTNDKATWDLQARIAERAVAMAAEVGVEYRKMDAMMDIDAVHSNGNPLRLQDLLDADNFNFAHDVFGIRRYLDRRTGQLTEFFVPRYSVQEEPAEPTAKAEPEPKEPNSCDTKCLWKHPENCRECVAEGAQEECIASSELAMDQATERNERVACGNYK